MLALLRYTATFSFLAAVSRCDQGNRISLRTPATLGQRRCAALLGGTAIHHEPQRRCSAASTSRVDCIEDEFSSADMCADGASPTAKATQHVIVRRCTMKADLLFVQWVSNDSKVSKPGSPSSLRNSIIKTENVTAVSGAANTSKNLLKVCSEAQEIWTADLAFVGNNTFRSYVLCSGHPK